jgi:hypothetical protein
MSWDSAATAGTAATKTVGISARTKIFAKNIIKLLGILRRKLAFHH